MHPASGTGSQAALVTKSHNSSHGPVYAPRRGSEALSADAVIFNGWHQRFERALVIPRWRSPSHLLCVPRTGSPGQRSPYLPPGVSDKEGSDVGLRLEMNLSCQGPPYPTNEAVRRALCFRTQTARGILRAGGQLNAAAASAKS